MVADPFLEFLFLLPDRSPIRLPTMPLKFCDGSIGIGGCTMSFLLPEISATGSAIGIYEVYAVVYYDWTAAYPLFTSGEFVFYSEPSFEQ